MSDILTEHHEQAAKLRQAYIYYTLEHGKRPPSIYKFMKDLDKEEGEFYEHYNSFVALEKAIWKGFFDRTIERLHAEPRFREYSVHEKVLAFFFTWVEVLKNNRSYVLYTADRIRTMEERPVFLKDLRKDFIHFMNKLIEEGFETGEILDRPLISQKYAEGLWVQAVLILKFWVDDESPGFEQTDALIEKSMNLSFELMGRGAVDSFIDLAKFLYRSR